MTPLTPPAGSRLSSWAGFPVGDLTPTVPVVVAPPPRDPPLTPPPSRSLRVNPTTAEPPEFGTLPRPGETFLGFRLVEELGRGTFARVFLAEQEVLAGRRVALKVSLRPTREAERLAKLQHANVVPVYSVHTEPPIQVICMPFLGRRTIADLLRTTRRGSGPWPSATRRTAGTRKVGSTTLGGSQSGSHSPRLLADPQPTADAAGGAADLLGDVGAVLRLLVRLADGLAHAHARGILHLDLKPANVLLADSGEPMLLDFNLSFDTTRPDREMVGGTVAYMAPEQLLDLRFRGKGSVDARTDLYSLGVVAFEMLTGSTPFPISAAGLADFDGLIEARRKGPPSLRECNPASSPAVESIVRKLLAPDPAHRYQSAADLKADLERHLENRPLLFARDRSIWERLGKWRRRNPRAPGRVVLAGVLLLAAGLGGLARQQGVARAEAEAVTRAQNTHAALDPVRLDLIALDETSARARGVERATELLSSYGLPDDPEWRRGVNFARLPEASRAGTAGDLGELLLLVAHARWQEARKKSEPERRAAAAELLQLNRTARGCFAPGSVPPFLVRQHAELTRAAGQPVQPEDVPEATTARDHFLDAVEAITQSRYRDAEPLLDRAVTKALGHGAAHFCLAFCRQQLGQCQQAAERYDVARALMPNDPRPFYQRGVIFGTQQRPAEAEAEFSRAIAIDPQWGEAYRNRGLARFRLGRTREADEDLTAALDRGARPYRVYTLRALVRDGLGDRAGVEADRKALAKLRPEDADDFLARGGARVKDDPKGALEDFQVAAERKPNWLPPVYNQIHVLANRLNDPAGALAVADGAVLQFPESAPLRAWRALLFARLGRRIEAHREADRVRALAADPTTTYQLACVYARTSTTHPGEDRPEAMRLLRKAVRDGYRQPSAIAADPDLAPLQPLAEFREFLRSVKDVFQ